ncbi:hypothetical protein RclHR1_06020008 [Rhizophagus clarus]|uniref:HTH myb-type domain-containing protein n=1 Tax=Rhizophagus clarus TaxID=94130 RepID=A0A2Z6RW52_9GLOM|nr:hypothetical protein RclHR1_06020008 [Rhizophagus clarus]GET04017.1 hypothetical protein GLOIN_2v1561374 [Rhizophagus clarus]
MPLFDANSRAIILNFMRAHGYNSNDYVGISKLIPQYNPKQIRQYWTNILDPRLNHSSLNKEEKLFIIRWIENRYPMGSINWGELINEIEQRFGKFRSKNKIKNFWNSRKRSLQNRSIEDINRLTREFDSINNALHSDATSRNSLYQNSQYHNTRNNYQPNHPSQFNEPYGMNLLQYPPSNTFTPSHFNPHQIPQHNNIHNIYQPSSTVPRTLQPNPKPPEFKKPYKMCPI